MGGLMIRASSNMPFEQAADLGKAAEHPFNGSLPIGTVSYHDSFAAKA